MITVFRLFLVFLGVGLLLAGTYAMAYLLGWYFSDPVVTTMLQLKMHMFCAVTWLLIGSGLGILWYLWTISKTQHN